MGLDERYKQVGEALERAGLPFTIGFTFHTNGVRVRGRWIPAVKMEWVEGLLVNQFVLTSTGPVAPPCEEQPRLGNVVGQNGKYFPHVLPQP